MKKIVFAILLTLPNILFAQIGFKSGLNFANVTGVSSINSSSRSGFMVGLFLSPSSKSIISSRIEIIYSRQGYDFKTGEKTANVNLDYIILPQLMGINITKFVRLQVGAQMAYLISAKADSTSSNGDTGPYRSVMDLYNKFNYGFAAGAEIHPFKGLLIGARYNISLGKLYSDAMTGQMPSFSSTDVKSNLVQIFAGWTFGNQSSNKKKEKNTK